MLKQEMHALKNWINENKVLLFITILIYQMAILAIGLVNFPYMDDSARQLTGTTDFGITYSRWGSEIGSWVVQGSRHLTDMGLVTPILTGIILAITSIIVVYSLNDKKLAVVPLIISTLIGLNPWFLQNVSFRFDSPYMAMSIFFSVLPFLWWDKKSGMFFITSIISLFLMCNTYQASSGVYIILVLALSFKEITSNENYLASLKKISWSLIAYIVAMLAYVIELKFNPELASRGGNVVIAELKDFPEVILSNSQMYLNTIMEQSSRIWLLLFGLLVFLFVLFNCINSKINPIKNLFFSLLYLIFSSILSYGVFLIFPEKLALAAPRYAYGFSIFVSITLILFVGKLASNWLSIITRFLICLFCYYILSFPFIYASALHYQKEAFERQSILLASNLKDLVNNETKNVYSTMLFKDSPIFMNTEKNYPILKELVPPNSVIFWPNQRLFKTYTGLNITIMPLNLDTFEEKDTDVKIDDYYHKIYERDNNLYIFVK